MIKAMFAFILICWVFAIALAVCLPASASVSTSINPTLIRKVYSCETTIEGNKTLSTVVDIGTQFTLTTVKAEYKSPKLFDTYGIKTNGYSDNDHYSKQDKRYTVTTKSIMVTASHCK